MTLMARKLAGPLAVVLLCVGVYWKLVLTRQYTWLDSPDIAYLEAPRLQMQAREWSHGRMPLWNTHQWCGQPLIGQMSGAAYPLNWAFLALAGRHERIRQGDLHWYFVLIHILAALNAYALCRQLHCSPVASVTGGMLFSLGGFLSATDWPPMMNGAVWAPLVFLFLLRAVEGRRPFTSAAFSGLALGMAWLSGHHEVPTYLSLAAGASWGFFCLRNRRLAPVAALAMSVAVLAGGLQIVTAHEYGRLAVRWAGVRDPLGWDQPVPYSVHSDFSFTPASLAGIVVPGAYRHANPFLGGAAAFLAAVGVLAGRHRQASRLFVCLAAAGVLLALGSWNVFHGLLYAVLPLIEKARVPARAIVLFSLAAAPLAALGLDAVLDRKDDAWIRRAGRAAGLLGALLFVLGVVLALVRRQLPDDRLAFLTLALLLAAGVVAAWRAGQAGRRLAGAVLCLLVTAETGYVAQHGFTSLVEPGRVLPWRQLTSADDVAQFLRRQPQPFRVDVGDSDYPGNFGDWYGFDSAAGFAASVTANIFHARQYDEASSNLLAITYSVRREADRPEQELLYASPSGLKVFRNPKAYPRAWVEGACAGGQVRVGELHTGRATLDVRTNCGGMVVLADTWFPGWKATVDGRPARIQQVHGALRGVPVGAGEHRIRMEYFPRSVAVGGAMTAAGMLAALLTWLFERRAART
ncbi:MAG: YfhO family protein [Acidobacteria bacterium]|nr:YfhO family protein [Acidobacteriota bacterium]